MCDQPWCGVKDRAIDDFCLGKRVRCGVRRGLLECVTISWAVALSFNFWGELALGFSGKEVLRWG